MAVWLSCADGQVWTGRAESSTDANESFDLETSVAYTTTASGAMVPAFVNVSHPLWVQTAARIDHFTNQVDPTAWDVPQACYRRA